MIDMHNPHPPKKRKNVMVEKGIRIKPGVLQIWNSD